MRFCHKEVTTESIMDPPLESLMEWIRTVSHGGHLRDVWHRQQIFALLDRFLGASGERLRHALRLGEEATTECQGIGWTWSREE
eukprot:g9178.t1